MTFKNIATKRTYTKDGVEKTIWLNVGTLRENNGKEYIELNMFPNTPFYVFADSKKPEIDTETGEIIPDLSKVEKKEPIGLAEEAGIRLEDVPF